jgi:lysyl-tRNA synthetase class 1
MFWADQIATEIKKRGKTLEWVDDMKTPSGRVHVGALRGVVIHDLIFKSLQDQGVNAKYTYVFDDHDPMDGLPVYLDQEKYQQYMGMPLFQIPSPEPGYASYAEFFAEEFKKVFNAIGCNPEIIWASKDLYMSGKMNDVIKECLDNADKIKAIYEKIYKKTIEGHMYPFQPFCEHCGKVSTTTVTDWDGENVTYTCQVDKVKFTKGCGFSGKMSPFSSQDKIPGKLPWKIEWPSVWKVLGITVEGAGKDHMTAGGSHDIARHICEEVLNYPTPFPLAYEWFILGKQKMSSSKGIGASARDMLTILPPVLLRFLMVRTRINSEINFDLVNPQMIPSLFDEYQKAADAYFNKTDEDLARMFALSQIGAAYKPPSVRFSVLAQWVQMPNMQTHIEKEGLTEWVPYVTYWLEHYAPESEKFSIQETLPESAKNLSIRQKELLAKVVEHLDKAWEAEKLQFEIYEWGKGLGLTGKETFSAIYQVLIGKDHGPKAAWLILSQDKEFVKQRFEEAISVQDSIVVSPSTLLRGESNSHSARTIKPEIFSINSELSKAFPSISVGSAIIKGVNIVVSNEQLEKEKEELIHSLENLTTEELGKFPEIISYRKLYKAMGVDWHSRRPSPEALLRRIALKKGLYSINTCVDAYNLVVMKHRVSVGAFDVDAISFPTELRFAHKGEDILLLGDSEPTKYTEKEVAYFDQNGGYNMDFNYRDAKRTAVLLNTKNLYINVDGVYDISPEKVEEVLKETCDMITKYCGGTVEAFGVVSAK